MPRYQVIAEGFYDGKLYSPEGRRNTLSVEKAFKKCPSWLKQIKAGNKPAAKAKAQTEVDQTSIDAEVAEATFLTEGGSSPTVETL